MQLDTEGDEQRPVKRELRWHGLCATRVARTESGPGLRRRPLGTVPSAHLASAQQWRVRRAFKARGSALMASSSGLCRRRRPWRGLCDARAPRARKATRVHRVDLGFGPFEAQHQEHQAAGHEAPFYH